MAECAFRFKSQGIEKLNFFSQGTKDCQHLRYEKSDYC